MEGRPERAKSSNLGGEGRRSQGGEFQLPSLFRGYCLTPGMTCLPHLLCHQLVTHCEVFFPPRGAGLIFLPILLLSPLSQLPQSLGTGVTLQAICLTEPFASFIRTPDLTQELENPAKVERELENLKAPHLLSKGLPSASQRRVPALGDTGGHCGKAENGKISSGCRWRQGPCKRMIYRDGERPFVRPQT